MIDKILNGNANPLLEGWLDNIIGIASNEGSNIGIDGLADNEYMNKELDKFDRLMNCRYTELYQGSLLNLETIMIRIIMIILMILIIIN